MIRTRQNAGMNWKTPVIFCCGVAAGAAPLALTHPAPDETMERRIALGELVGCSSHTRALADAAYAARRDPAVVEQAERAALPPPEPARRWTVLPGGTLLGIDFGHAAMVVVTPHPDGGVLAWRCEGYPSSLAPRSCK